MRQRQYVLRLGAILPFLLFGTLRAQTIRFAVIGDYGVDTINEGAVASRLKTYNPALVLTTGDNNYFLGGGIADWDRTQGKYYSEFIKYPAGSGSAYAGNGVTQNNFYPSMGNHDWDAGVSGYTSYFELPGNERYYSFVRGPVEFFILDSDSREPDGMISGSGQYNWAQNAIQNSAAAWQLVFFHHPAWTYPTNHGPTTEMRWPFQSWGADAVFSGHNHNMQRMSVSGLPYYVIGSSGNSLYPISGSPSGATGLFYDDTHFGFMLGDATNDSLTLRFVSDAGTVLETSVIPEPAILGFWGAAAIVGLLFRGRSMSLTARAR